MEIILRFFIKGQETRIASINLDNQTGLIPHKGEEVCLRDIMAGSDSENLDYDYYRVKKVFYDYGDDLTLVDVFVCGEYYND